MTISSRLQAYVSAVAMALPLMLAPFAEAETIDCGAGDVQCLIAAINEANADPHTTTIRLAGGTYALTSVDNDTDGPNGLPSIVSPLTIDGASSGAILTRLAGIPGFRILHVGASGRLTLQGVTITNTFDLGFTGNRGSGLFNDGGVVTVVDSSFIENEIADAGALHNNQGVVRIIDSAFTGNFGSGGAGVTSAGGVVDIRRTVFENNNGLVAGGLWSMDADVRIVDSRFTGGSGHFGVGGVRVSGGTASIIRTTFAGNVGDPSGGILVEAQGTVIVRDSAFVENRGFGGGGGLFNQNGTVDVTNTTFARNVAGSLSVRGSAILNFGKTTIVNSTFAQNTSIGTGTSSVIANVNVFADVNTAEMLLQNTILVHSSDNEFAQDCAGIITSLGNNLIGDPSSCIITLQPSDLTGDAGLGQLVDDGTAGKAHYPLLLDSQAIDAANDAACLRKDQIGQPRHPECDIGAIEFRADERLATE